MDFHARVWKSDQAGWNSMQGMEIYPVHGISTRGWMEIQPSASKYLDGNPTKLEAKPGLQIDKRFVASQGPFRDMKSGVTPDGQTFILWVYWDLADIFIKSNQP